LVFRLLMTTITMRHAMSSGTTLPRWATKQAEDAVSLVLSVYNDHGQLVSQPIWRLCQNLIAQVCKFSLLSLNQYTKPGFRFR